MLERGAGSDLADLSVGDGSLQYVDLWELRKKPTGDFEMSLSYKV